MLGTGLFSDFNITCGGGRYKFKVHQIILAAKSDFFKKLCGGPFRKSTA